MPHPASLRSQTLAGAGFALICGGVFLLLKSGVPISDFDAVDVPIAIAGALVAILGGVSIFVSGDGSPRPSP